MRSPSKVKVHPLKTEAYNTIPEETHTPVGFYDASRPIFIFAQFFSVMPVNGLWSTNVSRLNFSWLSLRAIHTIIVISLLSIFSGFSLYYKIFTKELTFDSVRSITFYTSNLFVLVYFLKISTNWPHVMQFWSGIEHTLPKASKKEDKARLSRKIRITACVFLVVSIVEHLLLVSNGVYFAQNCSKIKSGVEAYYRKTVPQIFNYFEYTTIRGMVASFCLISSTFLWNYMDVFIIIIGQGLSEKFRQINQFLLEHQSRSAKGMPLEFWLEFRRHYQNVVNLCDLVDDTISSVTLVSFSNNFFFICIHLMNLTDPHPTFLHSIYYFFSVTYLIVKSFFVSKECAAINEYSKVPLNILRAVPSSGWHPELKRILEDIRNNECGLTGMKFFVITKRTILTVAGAILTYDLVLIGFHKAETNFDPCFS